MNAAPEKAAESFGITVEKLEKIRKRRDCPKGIVDSEGFYNTEIVGQMLDKMRKQAAQVREYQAKKKGKPPAVEKTRKKATKKRTVPRQTKEATARIVQETFDEYVNRFWETDERWRDFVSAEVNETYLRYFIDATLRFGHATAFPEE